jgi:hypothetical protein
MNSRHQCVDCSLLAPAMPEGESLVTPQIGWRLSRKRTPEGTVVVEWRCPACWKLHRQQARQTGEVPATSAEEPSARGFFERALQSLRPRGGSDPE